MATQLTNAAIIWPPSTDVTAEERDRKLDQFFDSQIAIEDAVVFSLEIKTLLTGSRDKVVGAGFPGQRNWCYPGLAKFPNCDGGDIIL